MTSKIIQKRTDPVVSKLKSVRDGEDRSLVFCEGEKLVRELLGSAWRPIAFYCAPSAKKQTEQLLKSFGKQALPLTVLSDDVMKFCSDLTTPPGLIALAKSPKWEERVDAPVGASLFLVLHGIQLPQNAGALLRTAEAAGVTKVMTTASTADLFGPKALRGSSGSAFRLPIADKSTLPVIFETLRAQKVRIVAATQNGKTSYERFNWKQPVALIVGSEGTGFTQQEIQMFDETVTIPMYGKVESLNVGIAAAICLFEAARQRRLA